MDSSDSGVTALSAVATTDPLGVATFSGLSARLFAEIARQSVEVRTIETGRLRRLDYLSGAVDPRVLLKRLPGSSRILPLGVSRVRPEWYWSESGFTRASQRFDTAVAAMGYSGPMLQVGTQVLSGLPQLTQYCITDCTVVQAVGAGKFSVSRASKAVQAEAINAQQRVLDGCRRVFALSRWAADSIVQDYRIPEDRVIVVGAGANVDVDQPRILDRHSPFVLFVGYDWVGKGGPQLVDAMRRVRRRVPTARLVVVGATPPVAEPWIDVVGQLDKGCAEDEKTLARLYSAASCLALLSDFDAFPNVILEAGYYGVPTVAFDEGSRGEVVGDGVSGLLVLRDPNAIAEALARLLGDSEESIRMGMAAQELVRQEFTWPIVVDKILQEIGGDDT